jgi:3'(2'), 5'-bisphosphate nucleotidase
MSDAVMTPEEIERELQFTIEAARDAGERALGLRNSGKWEGRIMADIGDQACDGYLQGLIRGRYPEDGILSEETVDSPERLAKKRAWIVDPLDGTKEFAQDRDDWAVHVALTIAGQTAIAAVALPSQGRLIWGVTVPGAERFGIDGEGDLLLGDSVPVDPPRIAVSRSHTPEWVERFIGDMSGTRVPAGSAGNKVAMLLLGTADIYVHKIGLKEWDTCAPETIARALGWTVCKIGGEEHTYNQEDPHNHELVVCRPAVRDQVVASLAASGA